jgi:hypothetical protein
VRVGLDSVWKLSICQQVSQNWLKISQVLETHRFFEDGETADLSVGDLRRCEVGD